MTPNNTPAGIAYLKDFRKSRRISLEEFGAKFDPPVNKTTVRYWERFGVPAERAVEIERVWGIPRQQLRPDLYAAA